MVSYNYNYMMFTGPIRERDNNEIDYNIYLLFIFLLFTESETIMVAIMTNIG